MAEWGKPDLSLDQKPESLSPRSLLPTGSCNHPWQTWLEDRSCWRHKRHEPRSRQVMADRDHFPRLPSQVFSEFPKHWRAEELSDPLPQERFLNLIFRNPNSLLHSRGPELHCNQPKRGWSAPPTTLKGLCSGRRCSLLSLLQILDHTVILDSHPPLQRSQRVLLAQDPGRQYCK